MIVDSIEYEWDDDLIWCPSQCRCNVTASDGTKAVLYLRWRWDDPWTGDIIVGFHDGDGISTANSHIVGFEKVYVEGVWHEQDIGFWRDDQLDEAKAVLISIWEQSMWMSEKRGTMTSDKESRLLHNPWLGSEVIDHSLLKRAKDYEEVIEPGLVRIFRGHPRYCPNEVIHDSHFFTYEYLDGTDQSVVGEYWCNGDAAVFAPIERSES